ncbi:MAG: hypothetical protein QM758_24570 [Armatimonas sp.]
MSSLEAALYNYALEESWDARLRKWKEATAEQVTEQRTRIRDIRDRLLHLIQDADDEGNRDHASVTTYAYLQSKDRLIVARQEQRQRRNNPDASLEVERDLLGTLIRLVEPHVPAARRLAMEAFLVGQSAPQAILPDQEQESTEETGAEDAPASADVIALLAERDRLANRVEAMEEARRRLEVELGTYDPIAIVNLVRKTRDRLAEAERELSPLVLERDALSREFGTFTAAQIIGQVRLLKDKNAELHQQVRFARSRPAPVATATEPTPVATNTASHWEVERIQIERAVALLEDVLGLGGAPIAIAPMELDEELQPLPKAA